MISSPWPVDLILAFSVTRPRLSRAKKMDTRNLVVLSVLVLLSLASTYHFKLQHQIEANINNHADAATVIELRNDLATLQRQMKASARAATVIELRDDLTTLQRQMKASARAATVIELRDDLTTLQRQMKASARAAAVIELRDDLTTLQHQIKASAKAAPVSAQMPELSGKRVGSSITTASRPPARDSKSTVSKCEADGGLYDCANSACILQRQCATNSGLQHCACAMVDGWSHTLNPTCASRIRALQQEESDLGHFALAKTVAGFQILVHKTDDIVSSSLLSHGFWENDHLKVCSTCVFESNTHLEVALCLVGDL